MYAIRTILVVVVGLVVIRPEAFAAALTASLLPPLPISVTNNAVTSVDHGDGTFTLYSFMGTQRPTTSVASAEAYRLDWPNGEWTRIADAPRLNNRPKVGASAITVGANVFLIGGYTLGLNERTEKRLFQYDPAADQYMQLADVPVEVDDTVVGVFEDRYIFLASGWHGPINNNVLNVQVYDTQLDVWSQSTPLPGPASGVFGHSGTLIGNRLVSVDGATTLANFAITDRVFVGEIELASVGGELNVSWSELAAHPGDPTYRAAASQGGVDGKLLLIGGTDNPYNVSGQGYNGMPSFPLDQALLFDPISSTWESLDIVGNYIPSMDHRGLIRVGDGWVTIGGMLGPGMPTDRVVYYAVPEPGISLAAILMTLVIWRRRHTSNSR